MRAATKGGPESPVAQGGRHEEWLAGSCPPALRHRYSRVSAGGRCWLGGCRVEVIKRDDPRLREQDDRRAEAGAHMQEERAPRHLELGRPARSSGGQGRHGGTGCKG